MQKKKQKGMPQWVSSIAASVGILVATTGVQAAPITYFGENQLPGAAVSGDPVTARASFLAALSGVGSEGFESFTPNVIPSSVTAIFTGSSGNVTATLSGPSSGVVDASYDTPDLGRFNTTSGGSQWWLAEGGGFTLEFDRPIAAFGFYGTDIGDFNGQLTVTLTDILSNVSTLTVNHTINGNDASLLFWGFIDDSTTYTRVEFGNTVPDLEGFGFDDFVIGDRGQVILPVQVPEPSTLAIALAGLGMLRAATLRRRKKFANARRPL